MPARKTKRNDGRFAFTLRYVDPITGEKKRAYFYGRTQTEARAKAESARQRLTLGGPVRDASRTVGDWLVEWEATFVNRLMLTMRDAGKADATRRNCYTALRKSLDDAVLSGLLALNVTHKVTQPRARRKEARFLTTEEVARLLMPTAWPGAGPHREGRPCR